MAKNEKNEGLSEQINNVLGEEFNSFKERLKARCNELKYDCNVEAAAVDAKQKK